MNINEFLSHFSLNTVFYGNTLKDYIAVFVILLVLLLLAFLLKKLLLIILNKLSSKTSNRLSSYLLKNGKKFMPIFQYIPFYITGKFLVLPPFLVKTISVAGIIIVAVCFTRFLSEIVNLISAKYFMGQENALLKSGADFFADIILWTAAALFILNNIGININALLAGIGIGGMALAFAAQSLLGDLFNYFTILIDKPFIIGDDIFVNGNWGTVQKIGLKGTRLLSADGEQLIISNTDMTKNVLKNYRIMQKRRKTSVLGIKYDTPAADLKEIPQMLEKIIKEAGQTDFVRAFLSDFGESSINFTLVYFVLSKDFNFYAQKTQEINFKILEVFSERKIEFAFPSQSLYIEKE
ncbi:MAG: mechanosensitive ion channel family protein [Elusimicrobiota bacterium]|jgi:small-conductance mechanosensitive channel|nr:mechanosensitive ion channel family protein [Elusimicrobiota bacterium]